MIIEDGSVVHRAYGACGQLGGGVGLRRYSCNGLCCVS